MEAFRPILLEVWRRACSQPHLAEAASGIADILQQRLPLDRLLVLALDRNGFRLRTAAATGGGPAPADPTVPSKAAQAKLLDWCAAESLLRGSADAVARQLPGLLPSDWARGVLACGLRLVDEPLGALILGADRADAFHAAHEPLVQALREPFAVALRNDRQLRELISLREAAEADRRSLLSRLGRQDISDTLIGAGTGLREVMRGVGQVARSDAPVLILGETGSGKEVIARAIHAGSVRRAGPFLRVNCGAIPPDLADSELFGHERGSFTGAAARRKGWFERADGGTLFLDEIGELMPAVQVRLLRILQDGTFERVGGQQSLRVDVRLVAATHRDLHAMVRDGRFRADLWYRINVFPLRLPALRERREDIPAMASHFALRAAERLGLAPQLPSPEDMTRLIDYPWPGNVRELAAVIERAAILGEGQRLEVEPALGVGAVAAAPAHGAPAGGVQGGGIESLDTAARLHIERALSSTLGRIEGPFGAALLLKIHPDTLRGRMRKLGIDWKRFRPPRA